MVISGAASQAPWAIALLRQTKLHRRLRRKHFGILLRTAGGISLVLLATWVGFTVRLNLAATSLLELLVVLIVALKAGFWPATVVSIIASCCLNYFFVPPVFSFDVADPKNWVVLIAFEISALVVSRLSTEAQRQAEQATAGQKEVQRLYEVSQQLLKLDREQGSAKQILSVIQRMFAIEAAALFDSSGTGAEFAGPSAALLEPELRAAFLRDQDSNSLDGRTWFRVLRLGVRPVGAIGLRGDGLTNVTANALASLTAIALERARSFERETHAEAERQSEQLRTTVLDALAHEYKTPLTAVRTATSGLIEIGGLNPVQSELVTLIDSEVIRLSELTTRLLQTSRLDKADLRIRPEQIDVEELIRSVFRRLKTVLSRHKVRVEGAAPGVYIRADRELVSMALLQFMDNAVKYSPPESPITVTVDAAADAVRISVNSAGAPIPFDERERIFERFYRGPDSREKVAGTGIGLSITRKVAEVHRGRVWVSSQEGQGNTFSLELPRLKAEHILYANARQNSSHR